MAAEPLGAPERVCPHCARIAYETGRACPYCGKGYRRSTLLPLAALLLAFLVLLLGGMAVLGVIAAREAEAELDRQVRSAERNFERQLDGVQGELRRELDRRLSPALPGVSP